MGLPMRMLLEHGVSSEQVEVLTRWFGTMPEYVRNPGDAVRWALSVLPWKELHPLLRRWYESALSRGELLGDKRPAKVLALLVDDPDLAEAAKVQREVSVVAKSLAKVHGASVEGDVFGIGYVAMNSGVNPTVRLWTGAMPLTNAVLASGGGLGADRVMVESVFAALMVLMCPACEGYGREVVVDRVIRDVMATLVGYVDTWVGGWRVSS